MVNISYVITKNDAADYACRLDESTATGNHRLGVNMDGHKELLGIWISKAEGAKFWLVVSRKFRTFLDNSFIWSFLWLATPMGVADFIGLTRCLQLQFLLSEPVHIHISPGTPLGTCDVSQSGGCQHQC